MCWKAVEIQAAFPKTEGSIVVVNKKFYCPTLVHSWYLLEGDIITWDTGSWSLSEAMAIEHFIDYTWLPRQDQLQEMVKGEKHMHLLAYEFACYFHGTVDPLYSYLGQDDYTVDADNSMEQMWLAFAMKELYNKTWNGEDWINA